MVTRKQRTFSLLALCSIGLWNCGNAVVTGGGTPDTRPDTPPEMPPPDDGIARYPGTGFVVHEWGTDTIVVGSDGSVQRGLHHEEEDLPGFVYDRMKAGTLEGSTSVAVKMETPVTYFYSAVPRKVNVAVGFPQGVFTQWYPAGMTFWPPIAGPYSVAGLDTPTDPVFNLAFPFSTPACSTKYGSVGNGLLDWGAIDILGRDDTSANLPEASLETFTWGYARNVDSNAVRISQSPGALVQPQDEKFLFYRGLGNFDLPVRVSIPEGTSVKLENTYSEAMSKAFVVRVGEGKGVFVAHDGGLPANSALDTTIPSLEGARDLGTFTNALAEAVTQALDQTGLYHDEALAMVDTWKRQWFGTPGIRVFYLIPQSWTDASIPLTVTPAPDSSIRVMMIRVEVIAPEDETIDVNHVQLLQDPATAPEAEAYFQALGRFAEPRLRRALSILQSPAYADSFLAQVTSAETRVGMGE
ncbi:MAG TPA: hypothetical protein PK156_36710 [Polyangium sp.]|nr:hypothetical protein [Polyangium sp.]